MSSIVRHITPIAPDHATGLIAEVYEQVNREFSSIGPAVQMLTPSEQIAAAAWVLLREAQLATGEVPLTHKMMVALGVAQVNRFGYDEAAFLAMLRIIGRSDLAALIEAGETPADPALARPLSWARSTGEPSPRELAEHRAELIGTALFSHFIHRMGAAMLPAGLHPGTLRTDDEPPFEGAPVFRTPKPAEPGLGLRLLADNPRRKPPTWASGPIGTAYAALASAAAQGVHLLTESAGRVASEVIARHRGRRVWHGAPWESDLASLTEVERRGAELAILAGLAPERITDALVRSWRATDEQFSDHCTVYLLSFGAMSAVERIEADV
ncbi:hypothetical protein FB566_1227 [Stackebrandtia endophytica]|uniref:Uncharacterized protein n=1 Tax=Stackebrandtia endophytica TaxID=1496996 RepID=A0A543AT75_9ACTN|nr:hypothetical protein [Stackebrandtia endophytica]TQL75715.1 hypothetical protein FB566_1227 [Stackebrandtia endophytica]